MARVNKLMQAPCVQPHASANRSQHAKVNLCISCEPVAPRQPAPCRQQPTAASADWPSGAADMPVAMHSCMEHNAAAITARDRINMVPLLPRADKIAAGQALSAPRNYRRDHRREAETPRGSVKQWNLARRVAWLHCNWAQSSWHGHARNTPRMGLPGYKSCFVSSVVVGTTSFRLSTTTKP